MPYAQNFDIETEIARQRRENTQSDEQRYVIMGDGLGRDVYGNLIALNPDGTASQYIWVRDLTGDDGTGYAAGGLAYRVLPGVGPTPQIDKPVWIKWQPGVKKWRVDMSDPDYMDAVGQSMHLENHSAPENQFVRTEQLLPLRAQWIGDGKISVQGYAYTYNGIGYQFPGTDEDTHILAADEAPAAGEQCYILLVYNYALYAAATFPVKFYLSTPKDSVTETLGTADLNECIAQMDRTVEREIAAFRLSGDVTDYYGHEDDRDRREWLNTPLEIPDGYITTDMIADGAITTPKLSAFAFKVSTIAPTVNDDSGDGYRVGSYWFNKTTGILYVASDVTVGAAVWNAISGSGAAPANATYLVQTANGSLPNAQAMGALGTGIVYNTTGTGVQSIAIAGTNYTSPAGAENLSSKTITASTVNSTPIGNTTQSTGAFTSLSALVTDAATNTITNVLTVGHDTSGTPAASYGTGLLFQGKSSTTLARDMGRVRTVWTTATDASRVANMILSANNASGAVDMVTISPTGVGVNTTPSSTSPLRTFTGNQTVAGTYRAMEGIATILPAASGAFGLRGLYVNPAVGGANNVAITGQIVGVESDTFVNNSHASTTVDDVRGFYTPAYLAGAASITNLYGTFSRVGTSGASTGGVGVMYAFYANPFKSGSGTIASAYGLYVTAVNMATTNYAIYTNAGLVRFGDQVSVIGSADRIQSIVRANATQTTNLAEWQTSGSTILASISGVGAGLLNVLDSSGTSAITNALTIGHNISGTPAAGFGTGALFQAKSSTTNDQPLATIDALWDVATHASRAGALSINVYSTTTKQEAFKAIADASGVKLGLNGAMPVARSTYGAPTGVLTRTTFDPSTVTLSQLAERVAAMITDFRSRGDFA